tara:strand:+ start:54 stop:722 length:669 start_codon:yes stop_codon:yes gene_type:complete
MNISTHAMSDEELNKSIMKLKIQQSIHNNSLRQKKYQEKYRKEYYIKNKELINKKAKQVREENKRIICPITGLNLSQLKDKKYWFNYKKNEDNAKSKKRRKERQQQYKLNNILEIREKDRQRKRDNADHYLNKRRIREFGITSNDYNRMLKEQNEVCYICKNKNTFKKNKEKESKLVVDHNHKTGKVRGLLCDPCNSSLGFLKEDINILRNCISYLQEFNSE